MYYRKDRTAPVWRQVPKEKLVNTVFLTKDVKTEFCCKCKQHKPVVDFYIESKSKRKHPDQLRNMCVDCWDMYCGSCLHLMKLKKVLTYMEKGFQ